MLSDDGKCYCVKAYLFCKMFNMYGRVEWCFVGPDLDHSDSIERAISNEPRAYIVRDITICIEESCDLWLQ